MERLEPPLFGERRLRRCSRTPGHCCSTGRASRPATTAELRLCARCSCSSTKGRSPPAGRRARSVPAPSRWGGIPAFVYEVNLDFSGDEAGVEKLSIDVPSRAGGGRQRHGPGWRGPAGRQPFRCRKRSVRRDLHSSDRGRGRDYLHAHSLHHRPVSAAVRFPGPSLRSRQRQSAGSRRRPPGG